MQLEFRLRPFLIRQPMPRQVLRPMLMLTVLGPKGGRARDALFDSGSDHCVCPAALAGPLGVDLSAAVHGQINTAGGLSLSTAFASVRLRMTDDAGASVEWDSEMAFAGGNFQITIFGYRQAREYFDSTISESRGVLRLDTTFRFPGTIVKAAN